MTQQEAYEEFKAQYKERPRSEFVQALREHSDYTIDPTSGEMVLMFYGDDE